MENARFNYFAFISYNHKDEKSAKWIQESLENFKFPTTVKKDYGSRIPDSLRPIFRDATDLNAGVLEDNIQQELRDSRYLIVVCSTNSAKSEWVNKEVEYFVRIGRAGFIIPVIINGRPDTNDVNQQCFVPALRNLEKEILGISIPALGQEVGLVKIVAKMLNLKFDQLWQRHERQKKRRMRIQRSLMSFLFLLIAGIVLFTWNYNREKVQYYADYEDKWGVPTGILPLTKEQVKHRNFSYKFVSKRGLIRRVEHINSAELPRDDFDHFSILLAPVNPAVLRIDYYPNNKPSEITFYDENNGAIMKMHFPDANSSLKVEFKTSSGAAYSKTGNGESLEGKIKYDITGYEFLRDEYGFISSRKFKNSLGKDVSDGNRVHETKFDRNDIGQVISATYFDKDGKLVANNKSYQRVRKYDSQGRLIESFSKVKSEMFDSLITEKRQTYEYDVYGNETQRIFFGKGNKPIAINNSFSIVLNTYNEKGYLTKREFRDVYNQPVSNQDGVVAYEYEYDDLGREISIKYFGKDGIPTYNKVFGVFEVKSFYESEGVLKECSYDSNGNSVLNKNGYACVIEKRNSQGKLVEQSVLGIDGNPIKSRSLGSCLNRYKYDKYHRNIMTEYYDCDGNLAENKKGYAIVKQEYDDLDNIVKKCYYGADGEKVILPGLGCSCFETVYGKSGFVEYIRYTGKNGELVYSSEGVAIEKNEHDSVGRLVKQEFFDVDSNRITNKNIGAAIIQQGYEDDCMSWILYKDVNGDALALDGGYAGVAQACDEFGNVIQFLYVDKNGNPTVVDGFAGFIKEYDSQNRVVLMSFLDTASNLIRNKSGVVYEAYKYDERSNFIEQKNLGFQKEPINNSEGIYRYKYEYDEKNRNTKIQKYSVGDEIYVDDFGVAYRTFEYDRFDSITKISLYDKNDQLVIGPYGYAQSVYEYDEMGNTVMSAYFDKEGHLVNDKDGFAKYTYRYDSKGREIERKYWGDDGKLKLNSDGIAVLKREFDSWGNESRESYYGIDNAPILDENGCASIAREYNEMNFMVAESCYDEVNKPKLSKKGYFKVRIEKDNVGEIYKQTYYGEDGNLIKNIYGYAIIAFEYENGEVAKSKIYDEKGNFLRVEEFK